MINQQQKNHLIILVIFGMSVIPVLIAWSLSKNTALLTGSVNKGQLISPVVATDWAEFSGFDEFSEKNIGEIKGHWLIVNVMPKNQCAQVCLDSLLKTKQLRLMLNKELPRTRRIVMILKEIKPGIAKQYWLKDALLWRLRQTQNKQDEALFTELLHEQNKLDDALVTKLIAQDKPELASSSDLIRIKPSISLIKKMTDIRKSDIPDGMLFLIDPLGNLMMQYEPGFDPYQVKSDLMHLLKISQIG
ncbi:MAG: hypothetical protein PHH59_01980 [Methylovulum sp.]|uniref:hypothetical protein n=1 Tax=Methylovulum sp. TaxID=1916980 RepID=UPI0026353183|nr:hypothetical protein [Methylovulum sp.]MDD2722779.1 hypothetical protein [Methylovulum sp.]MDD5124557.1 hypothetical protein [Methylovulum sp.]